MVSDRLDRGAMIRSHPQHQSAGTPVVERGMTDLLREVPSEVLVVGGVVLVLVVVVGLIVSCRDPRDGADGLGPSDVTTSRLEVGQAMSPHAESPAMGPTMTQEENQR